MSILSTNQRLISLGQDYSAGENIGIYEHTISSRNWTPDITYAAESAFQRATGYTDTQISALSSEVSSEVSQLGSDIQYISGVALTAHQSLEGYLTKASGDEYYQPIGSYATVSQLESTSGEIVNLIPTDYVNTETLEQTSGNIVNLIPDTSEFITNASAEQTYQPIGNYLSSNALEGYATQDWVSEQGYITGVSIPESATWQDVSETVQTNSATWGQGGGGGDAEVNSFVYNNSATINEVNASYQTNSGDFLTAAPADMATTGDIAELAQTVSETYQTKGDYLVRSDSANFYPANNPSSFATEDWVTAQGYITTETDWTDTISAASANAYNKASEDFTVWENTRYSVDVQNTRALIGNKLDESAFSDVSSTFLTAINIPDSATWNEVSTAYQTNSATYLTAHQDLSDYYTTADANTLSSMLSGAIDYVSANAGDEFPVSADEAIQYVQTNSGTIDDVNTSYQTNSGTFLTAHQAISAEEWNDCYDNVNTNSGAWGGSALPISAGPGIKVNLVDNTLVFSNDETLLWENNGTLYAVGQTISFNESPSAFEKLEFKCGVDVQSPECLQFEYHPGNLVLSWHEIFNSQFRQWYTLLNVQNDGATAVSGQVYFANLDSNSTFTAYNQGPNWEYNFRGIQKIVGINRKQ